VAEPAQTLADLGEWELIRRLGAFAPPGQFADDAALLPGVGEAGQQGALVVNTDVLVEGLHFSDATTGPGDVGWRAAAANLSDLAAMGCTEVVGLTVGLVAPASTTWAWVEGVYGGLREALDTYGGVLLGGDCSGGAQRLLAITAFGRLGGGGHRYRPAGRHHQLRPDPPQRRPGGRLAAGHRPPRPEPAGAGPAAGRVARGIARLWGPFSGGDPDGGRIPCSAAGSLAGSKPAGSGDHGPPPPPPPL
jgi:hypothetical protein